MSTLRIEVFVPDTPAAPRLRLLTDLFTICGGCTVTRGDGYWFDESAGLISERVHTFLAFTEDTDPVRLCIESLLLEYKADAVQECVMYVLNSTEVIYLNEEAK